MAKRIFPMSRIGPRMTEAELFQLRREWINHMRQNRKNCSCYMCGNPRRTRVTKGSNRLTMQERRAVSK